MKKALLLCRRHSIVAGYEDTSLLVQMLNEQASYKKLPMTYDYTVYENLLHVITPDSARIIDLENNTDIADYDIVYHRRWNNETAGSLAAAIYLEAKGVPYIDREAGQVTSRSKLTQMWRLWQAGLPVPPTVAVGDQAGYDWLLNHLGELPFGFPMILKGARSTRGQDNYLVHSKEELARHLHDYAEVSFLLQEFIPNDCDYRVIVCGQDIRLVMRRTAASNTHANNTSLGGTAELVAPDTLPANVLNDCIKAAQLFGRDFAGVDVTLHKQTNRHYFFEVNRAPQVESGKYVDEKAAILAQYLYDAANHLPSASVAQSRKES
jgi:glutathione synthase/RimK-type ligase-like ATP-grasp enzyme